MVKAYFEKWWVPSTVAFCMLLAFSFTGPPPETAFRMAWANTLAVLLGLSLLGIIIAAIWHFIGMHWGKGVVNLLMFPFLFYITFFVLISQTMLNEGKDEFGKDIVIPPDMEVAEPLDGFDDFSVQADGTAADEKGQALIDSFSQAEPGDDGRQISVDLPVLNEFSGPGRDALMRHLATSARWHMTLEKGKVYAYRRFVVNGRWQNRRHGYYVSHHFGITDGNSFQFRIVLAPDGSLRHWPWPDRTTFAKVSDKSVRLKTMEDTYKQGLESYLVLESDGAALEIYEISINAARPFTQLAIKQVEEELIAVLSSPLSKKDDFDRSLLPPGSIKKGDANIYITNGMQGGFYFVFAHINPGEAGYAYLKVYEATRNTPLSAHGVKERSRKLMGWSNIREEKFHYNSRVTIFEGDWGTYYPARFELWFVPDSGGKERKLIEKIYKIEGYQR